MARALREKPMDTLRHNLARVSRPEDIDTALRAMAPITPSAEYVALANEAAGNPGNGPETVAMMADIEREFGGMYGALPLAPGASARLPVHLGPMPQGSMQSAEAVARAKAAGLTTPDEARGMGWRPDTGAFAGAKASGTPNPKLLAAMLRAGR